MSTLEPTARARLRTGTRRVGMVERIGGGPVRLGDAAVVRDGTLIVERILERKPDGTALALLRPPARWTLRADTTAEIEGFEHEIGLAVPRLREIDGEWTEVSVDRALSGMAGQTIVMEDPGVRDAAGAVDAPLRVERLDSGAWHIRVGVARVGDRDGF